MGNNIKGITIEIGGNTGPLTSALKDVNKAAGNLQGELREVNKQLKFDPQNTVLATQKLDLLKQSTQTLEEKQKTLKTAVEQAHAAFEKGDMGADKVRTVEREYEKVNSQLKETKKDLATAEAESGNFTEKVKGKFAQLKDKIKDTFSAENVKVGIGAVGVAVGGFLKGSMDEAKDAQKANADLEQTLKSTKGASGMTMESLESLSQAMAKNTTFADDEVKSGEGMLLTFTNIGKDVFPQATAALLDMSQKMGTDTKTQAMQLGKALNDPVKGVTALTRVGVTFTDQQKKQIESMQKAGDTAGAQKIILAELNKEFGGQASAAAETYDSKQKKIANTMKEIKETIGTALMPALAALLKPIEPIIKAVAGFVSKNPQLTAGILAAVAVIGALIGGLTLVSTVMGAFSTIMGASVVPTAAEGVAAGGAAVGINAMLLPILAVIAAIAALIAVAVLIVKNWSSISTFFANLWHTIQGLFSGIGKWFESVFSEGANGVKSVWSGITGFFSGIWNGITGVFNVVGTWFSNTFGSAYTGITSAFSGLAGFFQGIWNGITGGVKSAINFVIGGINTLIGGMDKIHFDIPDWVPLIGGKSLGINIPKVPLLAQGGVVNQATLAMIGEAGREAVVPLENNLQWIKELAAEFANALKKVMPDFSSTGVQVNAAMSAAYGTAAKAAGSTQRGTVGNHAQTGAGTVFKQTVNNYSPKALTPAETARQTRNATRRFVLALQKG